MLPWTDNMKLTYLFSKMFPDDVLVNIPRYGQDVAEEVCCDPF